MAVLGRIDVSLRGEERRLPEPGATTASASLLPTNVATNTVTANPRANRSALGILKDEHRYRNSPVYPTSGSLEHKSSSEIHASVTYTISALAFLVIEMARPMAGVPS